MKALPQTALNQQLTQKMRRFWLILLLCLLPIMAHASPRYRITGLQTPPGYQESHATGVNDHGEVCGYVTVSDEARGTPDGTSAVIWKRGRISLLPSLPSPHSTSNESNGSVASGINNSEQIVGTISDLFDGSWLGWDIQAVLWDHGKLIKIPCLPKMNQNTAIAVNDAGQVAGTADYDYLQTFGPPHIYLFDHGKSKDLGDGSATGLNQAGQVSGFLWLNKKDTLIKRTTDAADITHIDALLCNASGSRSIFGHGYAVNINKAGDMIGTNEVLVDLDSPLRLRTDLTGKLISGIATGDVKTNAYARAKMTLWRTRHNLSKATPLPFHWLPQAINAQGPIVGDHWLYQNGKSYDLNHCISIKLGWKIICATAINKTGQIVGYGRLHGKVRAFLMTPIRAIR